MVGKALVKLGKIVGDDKSIVSDIVPINMLERVAGVLALGEQPLLRSYCGQSSHGILLRWRRFGCYFSQRFRTDEAFLMAQT